MQRFRRIIKLVGALLGFAVFVWLVITLVFFIVSLFFGETIGNSLNSATLWTSGYVVFFVVGSLFSITILGVYFNLPKVLDRGLSGLSESTRSFIVDAFVGLFGLSSFLLLIWSHDANYQQIEHIASDILVLYFFVGVALGTYALARSLTFETKVAFSEGWAIRTYLLSILIVALIAVFPRIVGFSSDVDPSPASGPPISRVAEYSLKIFLFLIFPVVAGCRAGIRKKFSRLNKFGD